jgi:hypothetical protein
MKARHILFAAGVLLASASAAVAESGFEPTNAVPNGLESSYDQEVYQLTDATRQNGQRTVTETREDSYYATTGNQRGSSNFELLEGTR